MKDLTIIPPIGELLDREHVKIEKGRVVHKYKLDNRFANRNNVITGGILSTALDMLCGHALHTMHDNKHATIELKTIFLASAYSGVFYGEGNVVKIGKSIGFAESLMMLEIDPSIGSKFLCLLKSPLASLINISLEY